MDGKQLRAVIAEDDPDIRALIELKLRQSGFEVFAHDNGLDALGAIREEHPELAVLDVMMPGLSGLDVVAEVRGDDDLQDVRTILLTARGLDDDLVAGFASGADDYMTKPFSPRELVLRAQAVIARGNR